MDEVMGVTLKAMQADALRLERVSSNLANALTPGYKRELMLQRGQGSSMPGSSFAHALQQQVNAHAASPQALPDTQVVRDMRVGTLKATGQSLDLALAGRGFFEVA